MTGRFITLLGIILAAMAGSALALTPGEAIPQQTSADNVSSLHFTARQKLLVTLTVKIGATSGYVMVFDAAALPANGAVTPAWCSPRIVSDGTSGGISVEWAHPMQFSTGIVAAFSTTGCDTLTASATAKIMGQAL